MCLRGSEKGRGGESVFVHTCVLLSGGRSVFVCVCVCEGGRGEGGREGGE